VPQQLLALHRIRLEPSWSEVQIIPYSERHRTNPLGLRPHMRARRKNLRLKTSGINLK
jgi:hypothetical protein